MRSHSFPFAVLRPRAVQVSACSAVGVQIAPEVGQRPAALEDAFAAVGASPYLASSSGSICFIRLRTCRVPVTGPGRFFSAFSRASLRLQTAGSRRFNGCRRYRDTEYSAPPLSGISVRNQRTAMFLLLRRGPARRVPGLFCCAPRREGLTSPALRARPCRRRARAASPPFRARRRGFVR